MTICVESMFSLPESWNANGTQYTYAACLPMPVSDEVRTKRWKFFHDILSNKIEKNAVK